MKYIIGFLWLFMSFAAYASTDQILSLTIYDDGPSRYMPDLETCVRPNTIFTSSACAKSGVVTKDVKGPLTWQLTSKNTLWKDPDKGKASNYSRVRYENECGSFFKESIKTYDERGTVEIKVHRRVEEKWQDQNVTEVTVVYSQCTSKWIPKKY